MGYLEAIRQSIKDEMWGSKLDNPEPAESQIDARINSMSVTALLSKIDEIDEISMKGHY